jgi:hypothetical protein
MICRPEGQGAIISVYRRSPTLNVGVVEKSEITPSRGQSEGQQDVLSAELGAVLGRGRMP